MAFRSFVDGGGAASHTLIDTDLPFAETITVWDAELLFRGTFHRAGPDLALTGADGRHHIIPGYFSSEHPPALAGPNGARLSADVVGLLAGSPAPGKYAQAQPTPPPDAIGKVEKVIGDVTAIRNGVAVALHVGDAVFKSDVIQTGVNSSAGISFPDGTALNVLPNTRLAVNDYSYDPNGNSNSALFSFVEGSFAFVAGKVAHTGDMKVSTPVATMGVRGTTGIIATASLGEVLFLLEEDYHTRHKGILSLIELGVTIDDTTYATYCTSGDCRTEALTPSQLIFYQQVTEDLFHIIDLMHVRTKSIGIPGSGDPDDELHLFGLLLPENGGLPLFINFQFNAPFTFPLSVTGFAFPFPVQGELLIVSKTAQEVTPAPPVQQASSDVFIWNGTGSWDLQVADWDQGSAPNASADVVEILSGSTTYSNNDSYTIDSLFIASGAGLNIASGTLTILNGLVDDGNLLVSGDPPALIVNGPTTIGATGVVTATGSGDDIEYNGTVTNGGAMTATLGGEQLFQSATTNSGTMTASAGGELLFNGAFTNEAGGQVTATGNGSLVQFNSDVINLGTLEAAQGATLLIEAPITNSGVLEALGGTVVAGANVTGTGSALIGAGGTFEIAAADAQAVAFSGSGTLKLDPSSDFAGVVKGLAVGDVIDLANTSVASVELSGTTLLVNGAAEPFSVASLPAGDAFAFGSDGSGGTDLTVVQATLTPLPPDQLQTGVFGTTVHSLAAQVEIDGAPATYVPDSAVIALPAGAPSGIVSVDSHGNLTYNDADFAFLSQGESESLGVAFEVQQNGKIVQESLTLTIVGANEPPVVLPPSVSNPGPLQPLPGSANPATLSNNFAFTDPNFDDTHTVSFALDTAQSNVTSTTELGSFSASLLQDSAGGNQGLVQWELNLTSAEVAELSNDLNQVFREVWDVTVTDNHGASATEQIVITLEGPSAPPFIWIPASPSAPDSSGNWNVNSDWTGGVAPGANDSASIPHPVIVTVNDGESIDNLRMVSGAIVSIDDPGSLTAYGTLSGPGEIVFGNPGSVAASAKGADPSFIANGTATLSGGGQFEMLGATGDNFILGAPGTRAELLNIDWTISGSGTIGQGDGNLTFVNDGTVDATPLQPGDAGVLILDTGRNAIINGSVDGSAGLLAATVGGTLEIFSDVDNTAGTIAPRGVGSSVQLSNVSVAGGKFSTDDPTSAGGGVIDVIEAGGANRSTLDGTVNVVTVDGYLQVDAGATLALVGTVSEAGAVNNLGAINLAGDPAAAALSINGAVTLSGNGTLTLEGASDGIIGGIGGGTLENVGNNIAGAGAIGQGNAALIFTNDAGGVVDADVSGGTLVLNTGDAETNAGAYEATNGGILTIDDAITNEGGITRKTAAHIIATGLDSAVNLNGGVSNAGTIAARDGGSVTFSADTVLNEPSSASPAEVVGRIASRGAGSIVAFVDRATLTNSGIVAARDQGAVSFDDTTVVNDAGGDSSAAGKIRAVGDGSTIAFLDGSMLTSSGIVAARSGGTVSFDDAAVTNDSDASGATGKIRAVGAGSTVEFVDSATLDNTGIVVARDHGTFSFDGSLAAPLTKKETKAVITSDAFDVLNSGLMIAKDDGKAIFVDASFDNVASGDVEAKKGGIVSFRGSFVANKSGATILADDGRIKIEHGVLLNSGGTVEARGGGNNGGEHQLVSETGGGGAGSILIEHSFVGNTGKVDAIDGAYIEIDHSIVHNGPNGTIEARGGGSDGGGEGGYIGIDGSMVHNAAGGLIEATHDGVITFETTFLTNSPGSFKSFGEETEDDSGGKAKGKIAAKDGGAIDIHDSAVLNGGLIEAVGTGSTVDFCYSCVINDAVIKAERAGTVYVDHTNVRNSDGLIAALGCGATVALDDSKILGGALHASSGGLIKTVYGSSALDGVDILCGSDVEVGHWTTLTLAGGTTMFGGTLSIDKHGTLAIESCAGATLDDTDVVNRGSIKVDLPEGSSTLTLADNATIHGGHLWIGCTGTVNVETCQGATLDGVRVWDLGTIQVDALAPATLTLDGGTTIHGDDVGTLAIKSSGTVDVVGSGATFDDLYVGVEGRGSIVVGSDENSLVVSEDDSTPSGTVLALEDATTIDGGALTIKYGSEVHVESAEGATLNHVNVRDDGTITVDASDDSSTVTLTLTGNTKITGDQGGELDIGKEGVVDVEKGGATFKDLYVVDKNLIEVGETAGVIVNLVLDDTTIVGGTLATGGIPDCGSIAYGVIEVAGGESKFDGSDDHAVAIDGTVKVEQGAKLELIGTIHNEGTIDVDGGAETDLIIDQSVKLNGGGTITLDGPKDEIVGARDGELDNVDNTISGAGRIGNGYGLTVDNETNGVVDADVACERLVIDTGCTAITNAGLLEATCSGTLEIKSDVDNCGGTIGAFGPHALTELIGITVTGGTLSTGDPYWLDDGVIAIAAKGGGTTTVFDGSQQGDPVTIEAFVQADSGAKLELQGAIHNDDGSIDIGPPSASAAVPGSELVIDGTVTLTGGGSVVLDGGSDEITGTDSGVLDNVDNTVSGAGAIGDGTTRLTFNNEDGATVDANVSGQTFAIDTGSNQISNAGILMAEKRGILDVDSDVDNSGGLIKVEAGSTADFSHVVTGGQAKVDGGTLEFDAPSSVDVAFNNGSGTPTYGALVLGDALNYSGKITGFAGADSADSDEIHLLGVTPDNVSSAEKHGNTVITITVGAETNKITLEGFTGILSIATDGGSGTLITDPPATNSSTASVSVGGPGNDTFVFNPGMGAETVTNFNVQQDTVELEHFANVQTMQQLAAAITSDPQGDAAIELGHSDSVTLAGVTASYLQAHLSSLVHLH